MKKSYKKIFTQLNSYKLYGESGDYLLLGIEAPYEGCEIDECKLFKTKEALEKYIDNNYIGYGEYVATYINFKS